MYDLTDLGYLYKGAATTKFKKIEYKGWIIIDVPSDVLESKVIDQVSRTINGICALEIPTSFMCNLRCKYCYIQDPRMKNKRIDVNILLEILERSKRLFPRFSDGESKVFVTPWAAEPLCDLETLEAVLDYCLSEFGARFKTSTSTNATIWNSKLERIFERLIKGDHLTDIQISLDGPEWVQNRYRPFVGGKGSYQAVFEFVQNFSKMCYELGVTKRLHHYCSTIHVADDKFVDAWADSARFFSEPNTWHFQESLPMRVSSLDFDDPENQKKFILAQKATHEVMKERVKQGVLCLDFYTNKLFIDPVFRSRNAFVYCSALNSQIGIDYDGSLYLCHGPITSPWQKPFMWLGNIFEGVISYQKLVRNLSWMYNTYMRGKCTTCPIHHYAIGNVCWSCPTHNLAATGEPTVDYIQKCHVFCDCFKYWFANAYMVCKGHVIERVPKNEWFTEGIDYEKLPRLPVEQRIDPIAEAKSRMHFDLDYDGLLMHCMRRVLGYETDYNVHLCSDWWKLFDFRQMTESSNKS